jgi:acyl-CoA reductase-like NAD-dependent aldehyde dehydrogenase
VLVDVDHSMAIMREETFGPAVGIMKVASDEEAVRLMNDSEFGLTAAIYSRTRSAPKRSAMRSKRARFSEPLRLPRSRARLDRRQEFRARLHLIARRL